MAVAFRDLWAAAPAGIINDIDVRSRQLVALRSETVGTANRINYSGDGLAPTTNWGILITHGVPPWVNVIVGDRIAGGWSQYGRYGPIVVANGAGSDQDVYFWEQNYFSGGGGLQYWATTFYNGGVSDATEGNVRGMSRGRQFYAFVLMGWHPDPIDK